MDCFCEDIFHEACVTISLYGLILPKHCLHDADLRGMADGEVSPFPVAFSSQDLGDEMAVLLFVFVD